MRIFKILTAVMFTFGVLFGPQPSTVVTAAVVPAPVPVAVIEPVEDEVSYLPTPCGQVGQDSDRSIVDRQARYVIANEGTADSPIAVGYSQTVTRYRSGGAARYLGELKEQIRRCGPVTQDQLRAEYRLRSAGGSRMVVEYRWKTLDEPQIGLTSGTYLILVQRAGDHVVVIRDDGWEGFPSRRSTLDKALAEALKSL